ncbi:hypothetical protein VB780_06975 [Leptolyngbya sp. CCNP1308]|uniref:hypothetical protein n=1 Tax=Leptolyngbya sp. CCNP1308 TaxID=3110255 RepID=UPI002B1FA656|nr:hypothetical protein [Leptolyngbya sp. CCNP1308]MEA5448303.1 hypothetical protein [Leptolyngbya sp. CCNP1308]
MSHGGIVGSVIALAQSQSENVITLQQGPKFEYYEGYKGGLMQRRVYPAPGSCILKLLVFWIPKQSSC